MIAKLCKICGCDNNIFFGKSLTVCKSCTRLRNSESQKKHTKKRKLQREKTAIADDEKTQNNKADKLFYSLIRAKIFRDGDVKKIRQSTIEKILGG